jgi:hypothetical protein
MFERFCFLLVDITKIRLKEGTLQYIVLPMAKYWFERQKNVMSALKRNEYVALAPVIVEKMVVI